MQLNEVIKKRRSVYAIKNTSLVSDEEIEKRVTEALLEAPTAFGSEAVYAILALNENHAFIWDSVLARLKPLTKPEKFPATMSKIAAFKNGHGTILLFKKTDDIEELKKQFPLYSARQDNWGEQNLGIAAYSIWLTLADLGLGASMQHYDPLIDEDIAKRFHVPASYKLEAEIVFGDIVAYPAPKEHTPLEERFALAK